MCVCACVCVCVCVCPDITYFLMVRATYYQHGVFLAGNLMWCASAIKKFIAYLTIPHQEKSHKNMHARVCHNFCVITLS